MKRLLRALGALLCCSMSLSNTLDPDGKNVCQNISEPSKLVCCTGWRQAGRECTIQDADQPCFTKKEVRDIIFERNELKTNLFLVQEELSYYQRQIVNEEMCSGFLLQAVKSAIKKRKTIIKAKMLGIPVNECSSDEEEKSC
ncbi:rab-interacting lysosomal protein-like [Thalassophryne amazonica]|uniref:rab-interacting lysosomal protein-like n=1 Tax=Thalassophryne amazonica TaxID=390379 RepID=UPI001471D607|nr:rab-interacting lysosomal protein-like [Thalassophryne amazonica]